MIVWSRQQNDAAISLQSELRMAHITSGQVFLAILSEVWKDKPFAYRQHSRTRRPPLPTLHHFISLQSLSVLGPAKYLLLLYHVDHNSGLGASSVRFNFFSICSGKILFLTNFLFLTHKENAFCRWHLCKLKWIIFLSLSAGPATYSIKVFLVVSLPFFLSPMLPQFRIYLLALSSCSLYLKMRYLSETQDPIALRWWLVQSHNGLVASNLVYGRGHCNNPFYEQKQNVTNFGWCFVILMGAEIGQQ